MTPAQALNPGIPPAQGASRLEDLVPIAVAIAAGCERCAERTVRRALERGSSRSAVARTLGIVAHLRSLECFGEAVSPEVLARMEGPLAAGEKLLSGASVAGEGHCCG
jgi:hypothetical protein